ncbi:unnamed protein product [Didymodactylos carnosus]|uniref:Uncharacterized protein n=1 Tax=Didymodactylos carnosus TaxID=1234261 RepID=A0A815FS70_9BILA|nr:unnamed protein product [Didymodactylos carnosus]CAF1323324.1 unnamed protein product [Didymodactylos carnosus]CAF3945000.1 unnamed protein product [Didymodactylos carnosus]CAF4171254.1 unnamed protein product [Didymodactylos carnosus]
MIYLITEKSLDQRSKQTKIGNIIQATNCVRSATGVFKAPSSLIDPSALFAKLYDLDQPHEAFPDLVYREQAVVEKLCHLGLMKMYLPLPYVEERANAIEKMNENEYEKVCERPGLTNDNVVEKVKKLMSKEYIFIDGQFYSVDDVAQVVKHPCTPFYRLKTLKEKYRDDPLSKIDLNYATRMILELSAIMNEKIFDKNEEVYLLDSTGILTSAVHLCFKVENEQNIFGNDIPTLHKGIPTDIAQILGVKIF